MDVIILNGASSSGKSSIAQELQTILPQNYLHIGIDTFISMMPLKANKLQISDIASDGFYFKLENTHGNNVNKFQSGDYGKKINNAYHSTVKHLADLGLKIIVDDVMDGRFEQKEWNFMLGETKILYVGVKCSQETLTNREKIEKIEFKDLLRSKRKEFIRV
jgi:chloramphenicol 3-O phosphotransferase